MTSEVIVPRRAPSGYVGAMQHFPPRRIVCLTEETVETLYLLGEQDRVVGVSGYTVRPPEAREKPKISAFINAKFDKLVRPNSREPKSRPRRPGGSKAEPSTGGASALVDLLGDCVGLARLGAVDGYPYAVLGLVDGDRVESVLAANHDARVGPAAGAADRPRISCFLAAPIRA